MVSVHLGALLALMAPEPAPATADAEALDRRCYRLMAELARDEDPRVSAAGLTGAQYFLGRIDARASGFDPQAATSAPTDDRERLIGTCGRLMGADGRDFGALGRRLARPDDTI